MILKKTHNTLSLMLINLRVKNFHLVSPYIVCEGVVIVEEYDKKNLYPMFIKCHNHLHHVLEYEVGCVD
jgi:hypothetical protein